MLANETPEEQNMSDPNRERPEDISPIMIQAANPEEYKAKEEKIIEFLSKEFTSWESWRKPLENLWNEIYKMYFSQPDTAKTPTRAKIFVPIVFQVIESSIPKLLNLLFGNDEFFTVKAVKSVDQPKADVARILLNYQLAQANFFFKALEFVKQMLLYGTSYFYIYWKVRREWVFTKTPKRYANNILGFKFGEVLEWETKREYKVVERRPEVEVLDILDVYPDPNAKTEEDAAGVFIQSWENIKDLRELGSGKFPVYANTQSEILNNPKDSTFGSSRQVRRAVRGVSNEVTGGSEGQIQLLSFWGKYDLDEDGIREEVLLVLANKKVLIRAIPNPFEHQKRPIVRCVLFPVVGEWFGLGLVEPIMALVAELNTLRRQRLDNINQSLNRMWKVLSGADVDLDTLVSSPNAVFIVDSMDSLEGIEQGNVTDRAYTEASIVQTDIENATAPKSVQGSPDSGKLGRTASGASMIIQQALEKFGLALKIFEQLGLKRVLWFFYQLDMQFIDNDDVLAKQGLYGHLFERDITPEMIRADVEFEMQGISDLTGREAKINQIMSFMSIFGKVLSPATITALAKKIWSLMGFDTEEVELQAVQPMPPDGGNPQGDAAANQLQNGAAGAPQVPHV